MGRPEAVAHRLTPVTPEPDHYSGRALAMHPEDPPVTMPIPDGSVIITPSQMYSQIVELTTAVRDLKGAVDPAISDVRHDLSDHEARIRAQESRRYVPPSAVWSAVALAVTALGVLAAFLAVKG